MMVGLVVSFFLSHQRVWLRISKREGEGMVLAGTTNRNRVSFEKVFRKMIEAIRFMERS
jgi:cytochrome c biogenesis protein ResB